MPWDSLQLLLLSTPLSALLLGLLLLYYIAWIVYARHFHPLAKYPGPFLASVSRVWIVTEIARGQAEKTQRCLHEQLGPIIRIAPNEVAIADPDAIKTIYAISAGFTKTDFYLPFRPPWGKYPDQFTCTDERVHASRRKIINNLYSMSSIVRTEGSIDTCTDILKAKLSDYAETGEIIDISEWVQLFAFDVIGQLFFSRMFGFMDHKGDHLGYIKSLDLILPVLTASCVMPTYIRPLFLLSGAMVPIIFKALKGVVAIEKAADLCIYQRQQQLESGEALGKRDILASLFDIVNEKGSKMDFGMAEVKTEVYVALLAGSDTTAAAITSILYHLMRYPAAYRKLMEEIDQAAESGLLSSPSIKYSQAVKLPYLNACIKEGMRLHPSVGLTIPRHVPRDGCEISGEWFPGKVRVGVNAAVVHRNKDIFGADADEFNPERWFGVDAANMDKHMFQFGGGARTCIGKNISLCEMYKMIPQLLRTFHLELAEPGKEWLTHNYWFNKPSKVGVKLAHRKVRQGGSMGKT